MPKWILFDLDDTLIPSSRIYQSALLKIGADMSRYAEARLKVKQQLPPGSPASHNRLLYFKRMLEKVPEQFTTTECLELMEKYEKQIASEIAEFWATSNNATILSKLQGQYRLAIITNENLRTQLLKLQEIDPRGHLFSWILTSEEVGFEKPRCEIFEAAIARTEEALPTDIYVVGDSDKDDIQPALHLGMKAIRTLEWNSQRDPHMDQTKVKTINKLEQILDVLPKY